ncbi:Serine/threonine-protein phosphatase 2B catalytic subunit alpha isoform [Thelohanellus kitauei]|uniref:Serine/threonine-protein phosphatase n=1 Tax=Thelohanellus kitauei TaxID=669202 RepID=A0A0C2ISA3_THEKT|nr:Serine/threonine-protein phosphatase 2B catalytic subunit alpha isoform [Thelohanellus kitauei]
MSDVKIEVDPKIDYRTIDRIVTSVPIVNSSRATVEEVFGGENGSPDLNFIKNHLIHEGRFTDAAVSQVIKLASAILRKEPNVLQISASVAICGDVHGQFYDLIKLFDIGGNPAEHKYLFLGDYVDRGSFSTECLLYLYCHKIKYPDTFFLLRGNHECRHLTEYFTFKTECINFI